MSVTSASVARPVTPTAVPTIASSATVLAPASESVTAPVSNSSTSLTAIDSVVVLKLVSLEVARIVMLWLVAVSASRAPATVTIPVLAIDREQSAGIVIERVADRVAAVRIGGVGRHADRGAHDRIFVDRIGCGIGIGSPRRLRLR